jgi:hypothetical protein
VLANVALSRNQIDYPLYCARLLSYFYYGNLYVNLTVDLTSYSGLGATSLAY